MKWMKDKKVNSKQKNKRNIKFSTQLIMYYFLATVIFMVIIGFLINNSIHRYGMNSVENQLIEQTKSSLDYIKQIIYSQDETISDIDIELADRMMKELSAGNRQIRLYDPKSNLLSAYLDGIKQSPYEISMDENHLRKTLQGDYAYISDDKGIFFAAPIEVDGKIIGIVEIVDSLHLLNRILSSTTVVLMVAGMVYAVFIILLSIYLARVTVAPIKKLVTIAERYAHQDFIPINIDGPYEIGQLTDSISSMGQKIQEYIDRQNQFVSNVSHELRTPLTAIKGYSAFLIDEVKGKKDLERAVFHLNNETERLTKMVNELLTLSRIDADREKYNMRQINLSQLVDEILESLGAYINTEDILLSKEIKKDIYIIGDPEKLIQVLLNVVDNAIKYSSVSKVVQVSIETIDYRAVIRIKDYGIGMNEDEIEKVFERFYRSKEVKAYKGTGLGLAISKEIVKAHKGDIRIESVKGKGTTVKMILPILDQLLQE